MRDFIEKWADQIGDWLKAGVAWLWKRIAYEWSIADTEGRIKIVIVLAVGGYILLKIL